VAAMHLHGLVYIRVEGTIVRGYILPCPMVFLVIWSSEESEGAGENYILAEGRLVFNFLGRFSQLNQLPGLGY